jgi:hypothetical protein
VGEVRRRFLSCDFTPVPHMDAPLSMIILCGCLRRATSDTVGGLAWIRFNDSSRSSLRPDLGS